MLKWAFISMTWNEKEKKWIMVRLAWGKEKMVCIVALREAWGFAKNDRISILLSTRR